VQLGLRPEHMSVTCDENTLEGKITLVEHLGEQSYLYVDIQQEGEFVLKVDGDNQYQAGDNVTFGIKPNSLYLFNHQGHALPRVNSNLETKPLP
jgi:ABC-type sugar transport system ATPase subunit